ncbi:MAG: hypothetical protein EZS28_039800 [Streblomastix strix]|uniref:Tyr recombinase domain-containing protein n=1 Tax=Streblomastix strix TaxID=222440 RepID=A0A5J4U351_9EUKA|nr:MAG: hypothetical protein EZS28_039800 [Streblomastix strix]
MLKTENQISLRLSPKHANVIETYDVYETDNEKLSLKLAIYEWIDRLKKQFPKDTDFLLWHKNFNNPTTTKDVSPQLPKLLKEPKIIGASAHSIRYSATTQLIKLDISERDLATFTHHSQNSRTVQQYYIFQSSARVNDMARQLTCNPSQDHEIRIPTQNETEIRRKFPNELKDRTIGMMLKVGWSAWNDNAEIRTLICQSLISLIQRIIDKEMLLTSCFDGYEEKIGEQGKYNQSFKKDQAVHEANPQI